MATETQTQTGQCATHGTVQATRDIPKMGFPFIVYAYLRSRAKRKPFLCPECGEAVRAGTVNLTTSAAVMLPARLTIQSS